MSSSESHLFVVQRKDGPARIAFSDDLLARLPAYHVRLLKRIAAAAPSPWPPSVLFVSEGEYRTASEETCIVALPNSFLDRVGQWEKRPAALRHMLHILWPVGDLAKLEEAIQHSLSANASSEDTCRLDGDRCACGKDSVFGLRFWFRLCPFHSIAYVLLIALCGLPILAIVLTHAYLKLRLRILLHPSDRDALFRLAEVRYAFGKGRAFNRTKRRLLTLDLTPKQSKQLNRMVLPENLTTFKVLLSIIRRKTGS